MKKIYNKKNIGVISSDNIEDIKITEIIPPRIAMRTSVNQFNIVDLIESIKEIGLICPICVMKSGDKFEVVAGNRRFEACKALSWEYITCHVIEENPEKYFKTMTAENYERSDITIFDEVQFIERLRTDLNMSQLQIAKYINKSTSYVNERVAITEYPQCIIDALIDGKITFSVAREFNKITDANVCETYLHYAIENGCTPEIARKWRKQWELQKTQPERDLTQQAVDNYGESMQSVIPTMKCAGCQSMFEVTELMSVYMCKSCKSEILK